MNEKKKDEIRKEKQFVRKKERKKRRLWWLFSEITGNIWWCNGLQA